MYWLLGILLKLDSGLEDDVEEDEEERSSWDDDKAEEESEEEEDEFEREVSEDECKEEPACIEEGIEAGDLSMRIEGLEAATAAARCWFLTAEPGFE